MTRLFIGILGLLLAGYAQAADCPPVSLAQASQDAKNLSAFGQYMGTKCLVFHSPDKGGGEMLEFLPPGETLQDWKHMTTINIIQPSSKGSLAENVDVLAARFIQTIQKAGGTAKSAPRVSMSMNQGGPHLIKYEVGSGALKEDSAVFVRSFMDKKLLLIHTQRRGIALTQAEIDQLTKNNGIKQ